MNPSTTPLAAVLASCSIMSGVNLRTRDSRGDCARSVFPLDFEITSTSAKLTSNLGLCYCLVSAMSQAYNHHLPFMLKKLHDRLYWLCLPFDRNFKPVWKRVLLPN